MDAHPLKTLLQVHLGSDSSAVLHLPHILSSIDAEALQPSVHTQKWSTRVHSLLHSKDPSARWAGLCIAMKTSTCSRQILMESAQGWITVVLPMLSKNESRPLLKASIRLLRYIFAEAVNLPEFQRQVATPNVPKFSLALVHLAEKNDDEELQVLILQSLTHLIPLYPTLHRALLSSLSSLTLRYLNGSSPKPTSTPILEAASGLYAILHYTGGKVGAANHWRKSVDDTVAFAWGAIQNLRTTFRASGSIHQPSPHTSSNEDPVLSVSLHLDRLRAAVTVLSDLMQAPNPRAVVLPIGPISRLCVALLACSVNDQIEGHVDPVVHSLECSVVPNIWELGCTLTEDLAKCAKSHLTPHLSQLLFYTTRHLESVLPTTQRISFLRTAYTLLSYCQPLSDPILPSRLARAVLPQTSRLLALRPQTNNDDDVNGSGSKSRKGKKRARAYEGDELFKTREVVCASQHDGEAVLSALDVLRCLLQRSSLTAPVQSIVVRTLLAILVSLPQTPPGLFSPDLSLHGRVYETVLRSCTEIGTATTSAMSKSLGLVIGSSSLGAAPTDVLRDIELMLHPRVPPLVRALPHVESLSLFRAEESAEERETRRGAGLVTLEETRTVDRDSTALPTTLEFVSMDASAAVRSQPPQIAQQIAYAGALSAATTASQGISYLAPGTRPLAVEPNPSGHVVDGPRADHIPVTTSTLPPPPPAASELPAPPEPLPLPSAIAPSISVPPVSFITAAEPRAIPPPIHTEVEEDEDEPMPGIDLGSDSETD